MENKPLQIFIYLVLATALAACEPVENWVRFSKSLAVNSSPLPTAASILSIDDDFVSTSLTDSSPITWVPENPLLSGDVYEVALGATLGGTEILGWTTVGTATSLSASGLSLSTNQTYYASVRVRTSAGAVASTKVGDGWKVVASTTNIPRYASAPQWNDYVKTATPAVVCAGTENGYFACLHGGQKRRVNWTPAANCVGLTIEDELAAFDWECNDTDGPGAVYFYTEGLKKSKGLADLVNATSWKANRVVIRASGVLVGATARSTWWTNPVTALPPNNVNGPVSLTSGTVYTVANNMTSYGQYAVDQETAIVTLPGATLRLSGSATAGTAMFDAAFFGAFSWLEGNFASDLSTGFLYEDLGDHSVIRRAKSNGFEHCFGSGSTPMNSSYGSQLFATRCEVGIRIKGAYNTFEDLTAIGNSNAGVSLGDVSDGNTLQNVLVANNLYGLYTYGSDNNNFIAVSSVNNSSNAIISSSNLGNTYHSILARNNGTGIQLTFGDRETFSQIVAEGIAATFQDTTKFTSNVTLVGGPTCSISGGTNPGLVNTTCANQGPSNATRLTSATKGNTSFVGAIAATDTVNTTNSNGSRTFATTLDWTNFSSALRGWGIAGPFPSVGILGRCTTGTCQIWDYILKSTDTDLRNVSADAVSQNAAFVAGAACPAYLGGNIATVSIRAVPQTYLSNAMEIQGYGTGDADGLCETGESCLYLPNYGAYQGSGDYRLNTCAFSAGTVSGVKLYAYPVN